MAVIPDAKVLIRQFLLLDFWVYIVSTDFRPATGFESALIARLLAEEFPGRSVLLPQIVGLKVRAIDKEGSLELSVEAPIDTALYPRKGPHLPIEAEYADSAAALDPFGPKVRILLHVSNGRLLELEFYKDDGSPILRQPTLEELHIFVRP